MKSAIETRSTPQEMNISVPTGGVIAPIVRLSTISRPRCTGSMPSCAPIGARIGVTRISAATLSSSMPSTSRNRLMIISISSGLLVSVVEEVGGARRDPLQRHVEAEGVGRR